MSSLQLSLFQMQFVLANALDLLVWCTYVTEQLYIAFQPLNIASLGLFMLLTIKGRKRLVSYKTISTSIFICIGITILLVVVSGVFYYSSQQIYICSGPCPGSMAQTSTGLITFALYVIFCYLPSLLIVIVCTLWSCAIYKKSYTVSHDSDLDRRIISMPIVLPLILITPTLLSATILGGIRQDLIQEIYRTGFCSQDSWSLIFM